MANVTQIEQYLLITVVDEIADDIAKNFNATKDKLLNDQREEIFRVYIGELTQKYEKGGAVRFSKQQQTQPGLPAGN